MSPRLGAHPRGRQSTRLSRKSSLPKQLREYREMTDATVDAHGYAAGLAGKPIYLNPTVSEPSKGRWLKAYRRGEAERRRARA